MQCNEVACGVQHGEGRVHSQTDELLSHGHLRLPSALGDLSAFFFIIINMKYSLIFVKINFCQKIVLVTFSNVSSVLNQLANFI